MSIFDILAIAIALSFDAMAVSAANGAYHHKMSFGKAVKIAFFFGLFQFFMPLLGYGFGLVLSDFIVLIGDWFALIVLSILGIRMIKESYEKIDKKKIDINNSKILLILSIATSIDALVVGVAFAGGTELNIFYTAILIGVTTFLLSLSAVYIGKKAGKRWGKKAEIVGGVILILIGIKIFLF